MELLEQIFQAGVVGAGGAGFPTHIKLAGKAEILLINAVECEPLLETDKYLIRNHSEAIIETATLLAQQIEAKEIIIGIKEKNTREIQKLREAIEGLNSSVKLHPMENFYPAGDEQILVYELTKRQIPPGGIPKDVGVVVCNVGTVVNIHQALQGAPVTDKVVTILGEVKQPRIVEVPIGTPIKACIEIAGGATVADYSVILGGPMMGRMVEGEALDQEVVTKTTGGIILLPKDHILFKRKRQTLGQMINRSRSACIQCSQCTDLCPRNLVGHPLRPHRIMRTLSIDRQQPEVLKEALLCCECGICELVACPMGLSPRTINGEMKQLLRKEGIGFTERPALKDVHPMRENRKTNADRLVAKLNLSPYAHRVSGESTFIPAKVVQIPLRQHIGKPAQPIVSVGDVVEKGQLIASIQQGEMGANIHASISGVVKGITDRIEIEAREGGVQ